MNQYVYDAYLVDECDDCRTLLAEGTTASVLVLANRVWRNDPGNERIKHLNYKVNGLPYVDPKLAIVRENQRVGC